MSLAVACCMARVRDDYVIAKQFRDQTSRPICRIYIFLPNTTTCRHTNCPGLGQDIRRLSICCSQGGSCIAHLHNGSGICVAITEQATTILTANAAAPIAISRIKKWQGEFGWVTSAYMTYICRRRICVASVRTRCFSLQ